VSIQIGPGEIHVWNLNADVDAATLTELQATLSTEELQQAKGFRFAIDSRRYVSRRGLVRATLANYTASSPQTLTFELGKHGKPLLAPTGADYSLHFNYSYSGAALLLAVSANYEIGIDIEAIRAVPEIREIAMQNFSRAEQQILAQRNYALDTFFTCWTAKEAVIKALGSGLSRPLDDFTTLTLDGGLPSQLQLHDYDRKQLQFLKLCSVTTLTDHHATLAVMMPAAAPQFAISYRRNST